MVASCEWHYILRLKVKERKVAMKAMQEAGYGRKCEG